MSRRGQVVENPVTGERAVVLTDPAEQPERVLVTHLFVAPGGRVVAEHFHPALTERFHVLAGRVAFLIDGRERVLGPGEEAEVPPLARHDWWQVGTEPAEVLVEVAPGERFIEIVGTIFGLARDGKVNRRGLPRPLQGAVTAHEYRDAVVFTTPPAWVQRLVFGPLARVGRALGRKPFYPEYVHSAETVEPDARALARLESDGRLRFGRRA